MAVRPCAHLTAGLVAAALLGGCGDGHARPAPRHPPSVPAPARPVRRHPAPYRWLVRTRGAPPSVATENRARGTLAWRLPGWQQHEGGMAQGNLRGYVARESVAPGETERIYAAAPAFTRVRVSIYRMGWYHGAGGREVLRSAALPLPRQPPCRHDSRTGLTACHWRAILSFRIPPGLPTGVYIGRLASRGGAASDVLFVVTARRPAPLLAVLPTATYQAYNAWGGDSLYPGGALPVRLTGTTQGVMVSLQRPYDSLSGAGQFFARDVALIRFLERHRLPVSYDTDASIDRRPGALRGHRVLLDFGHSEYWSQRMLRGFAAARDRGTSLVFLSSDTAAWRIRYAGPTIVAYKELARLDPARAPATFGTATAALTGSRYLGCITPRLAQPGPPTYRLYAWRGASGPRWLFAGTGLHPGAAIPGIIGYELDTVAAGTPPGTRVIGGGSAPCLSPQPGEPVPPPGLGRASTTLYRAHSGAYVFASGTLSWELGLEPVRGASPDAPRSPNPFLVRLTLNLLRHLLPR